jgi:hypothetical protein
MRNVAFALVLTLAGCSACDLNPRQCMLNAAAQDAQQRRAEYERRMDEIEKREEERFKQHLEWCDKNPQACALLPAQQPPPPAPKPPTICLQTVDGVSVCP